MTPLLAALSALPALPALPASVGGMVRAAGEDYESMSRVRPGWIPFIIVLALGVVVAFLYFSMKKQLGRIRFPEGDADAAPDVDPDSKPRER